MIARLPAYAMLVERRVRRPMKPRQMRSNARPRCGVDEQTVDDVGEAVAGGAVHRPGLGHVFVRGGDLLGDEVQRSRAAAARRLGQDQAGAARVAVLQARGSTAPGRSSPSGWSMRRPSTTPARRARARATASPRTPACCSMRSAASVIDVEEAPVVDLVGGHAPVRQAARLRLEQRVQRVDARRASPARPSMACASAACSRGAARRAAPSGAPCRARARAIASGAALVARRQVGERRGQARAARRATAASAGSTAAQQRRHSRARRAESGARGSAPRSCRARRSKTSCNSPRSSTSP